MKILGLDLGIGSIGWCLIEVDEHRKPIKILGIGCRIINFSSDEINYFERGKGKTVCSKRTDMRTSRKCNWRYKMRRSLLKATLSALGMFDKDSFEQLNNMSPLQLWQLRADAATCNKRLSLPQLGRVLLHLNQKRGYRHVEIDESDCKTTDYVANINGNFAEVKALGMTIGQFQHSQLKASEKQTDKGHSVYTHQIKNTIYPREAYESEFDLIMAIQSTFYPTILTPEIIKKLRNIIFRSRRLKSCKHLVSLCEFEKRTLCKSDGTQISFGPKVAPRTSPIAQVARLLEAVNNIRLVNLNNRNNKEAEISEFHHEHDADVRKLQYEYKLTNDERKRIFDYLNTHDKLTTTALLKLLGLKKSDGFVVDNAVSKGIKGNETYLKISEALGDYPDKDSLLRFDLKLIDSDIFDADTGEVVKFVSPDCVYQPLYRLWHILYSIRDKTESANALKKTFGIEDPDILKNLCAINFVKAGFSNRSAKFMRKLIPRYMEGLTYDEAATVVGVNYSDSLTSEENDNRPLLDHIEPIAKNSLRQPLVEKVLNQMINVVNALIDKFGQIDEARVELARQLKQSKKERIKASAELTNRENENKKISELIEQYGVRSTRSRIQKYRMWRETEERCMYCGQIVGAKEFLDSHGAEIEHIIPKSLYFDDSFANKTCSCRKCNQEKNNRTAYDYMSSLGKDKLEKFEKRVIKLYNDGKISQRKREYLLMEQSDIPTDFINRDLRQTQYIAKKAREVLRTAIRNVWASSGAVTDFFRHAWGYDMVLHDLNIDKYALAGLVVNETHEHKGESHIRKQIKNWTKRLDHRHHAIDALTIALTTQAFVQRLNNLSSQHGNLFDELKQSDTEFKHNQALLKQWAASRPHFSVKEVAEKTAEIAISIKQNSKLTTPGKRYRRKDGKKLLVQEKLIIPRVQLHESQIYGIIHIFDGLKPLAKAFENPELVISPLIRLEIKNRIKQTNGDISAAVRSIKNDPLICSINGKTIEIKSVKCWHEEYVIKVPVINLKYKKAEKIVDKAVRQVIQQRYEQCGNDKKAFRDSLVKAPLLHPASGFPIKTVRCRTGIKPSSVVGARKNDTGEIIGYAKTGGNHHIAIYLDQDDKPQSMVTSLWAAVMRKMNGLSPIIKDPAAAWDYLSNITDEATRKQIANSLPHPQWRFVSSMQINEMFIIGMSDDDFNEAISRNDMKVLCQHLYRVQSISNNDYSFRKHTETSIDNSTEAMKMNCFYRITSHKALADAKLRKVRISLIGELNFVQ